MDAEIAKWADLFSYDPEVEHADREPAVQYEGNPTPGRDLEYAQSTYQDFSY